MSDPIEELKSKWVESKNTPSHQSTDSKMLITSATKKFKGIVNMHLGNMAILTLTLIGIICFFIFVAPFKETLSHIGMLLMTGGLLLRIVIEGYSVYRSAKLDMTESAMIANRKTLGFHAYRKRIHGPVTIGILLGYTVGFYLLTPEFGQYFSTAQLVMLDVSYLGAAAIFGYSIRTAIRKEMKLLNELRELQGQLVGG